MNMSLVNVSTPGNCRDCALRKRIGCTLGDNAGIPTGKRADGCPIIPTSADAKRRRIFAEPYTGQELTTNCGGCGGEIDDGDRFCRHCGVPLLWKKGSRYTAERVYFSRTHKKSGGS